MRGLKLTETTALRVFTLHMAFDQVCSIDRALLLELLSTITSRVLREFVLELNNLPSQSNGPSAKCWGGWREIDRFFDRQFAAGGDFCLVVRTGDLIDRKILRTRVEWGFPLLVKRGCVHIETFRSINGKRRDYLVRCQLC